MLTGLLALVCSFILYSPKGSL
ncbi:hypothetical protein P3J6_100323 [Pseudoalteromonas sp. 3J6]|nr:hypothetical protein P3J6_100323 [Pseudoalteromonas sp. 3J6]